MSLMVFVDVKQYGQACESEFRSCVKVEVAVLGSAPRPNEPYGFCGRKATLNHAPQFVQDMNSSAG